MTKLRYAIAIITVSLLRPLYYFMVDTSTNKEFLPVEYDVNTLRYLLFEYNYYIVIFFGLMVLYLHQYNRDELKDNEPLKSRLLISILLSVIIMGLVVELVFINLTNDFALANNMYSGFAIFLIISIMLFMTYLQFFKKKTVT